MTYFSTKTVHGRPEKTFDTAGWAEDLTRHLGGRVEAVDGDADRVRIVFEDGFRISAYWSVYNDQEKVTVRAGHVRENELTHNERYGVPHFPDAKVSGSREISAVARDILRRVGVPGREVAVKFLAAIDAKNKSVSDLDREIASLAEAFPALRVGRSSPGRKDASIYADGEGLPFISGTLRPDGSVDIDRLGSLSQARFRRVLEALLTPPDGEA